MHVQIDASKKMHIQMIVSGTQDLWAQEQAPEERKEII